MVLARCVRDGLDTVGHAQKRRVLLNESSQAHHDRRGLKNNIKNFLNHTKNLIFSSKENRFYDAILKREHHFYNRFHSELHSSMKYTKNHKMINIASLFLYAILILHENVLGKNESVES